MCWCARPAAAGRPMHDETCRYVKFNYLSYSGPAVAVSHDQRREVVVSIATGHRTRYGFFLRVEGGLPEMQLPFLLTDALGTVFNGFYELEFLPHDPRWLGPGVMRRAKVEVRLSIQSPRKVSLEEFISPAKPVLRHGFRNQRFTNSQVRRVILVCGRSGTACWQNPKLPPHAGSMAQSNLCAFLTGSGIRRAHRRRICRRHSW